jgi:hypothetical protein
MRIGVGPSSKEMYELLAQSGQNAAAIARAVEQRFREYPSSSVTRTTSRRSSTRATASPRSSCARSRRSSCRRTTARTSLRSSSRSTRCPTRSRARRSCSGLYGVESPTRQSIELCGFLVRATAELATLLGRLKGLRGSAEEVRTIKEIEDEADDVARAARAGLFKDDRIDPTLVIRWKDIYEALEDAVDACETAASRVGNILVKNA